MLTKKIYSMLFNVKKITLIFLEVYFSKKIFSLWVILHSLKITFATFLIFYFLSDSDLETTLDYITNFWSYQKIFFLFLLSFLINFFLFITLFRFLFSFVFGKILIVTFYILQTLFYFIYFSYVPYNLSYIDLFSLILLIKEAFALLENNSIPLNFWMLVLIIDLPLFIFILKKDTYKISSFSKITFFSIFIFFFFVSFSVPLIDILYLNKTVSYFKKENYESFIVKEKKFIIFHGLLPYSFYFSIYNLFKKKVILTDHSKIFSDHGRLEEKIKQEIKNPYNFILIQVESLPSGIIEEKYKGRLIMPFLNKLSFDKNVTYSKYMLNYHGTSGSFDSTLSVINNIEPLRSFPTFKLKNESYKMNNSIISVFKNQNKSLNYIAYSFESMYPWVFNANVNTKRMGFDIHFSKLDMYYDQYSSGYYGKDNYMFKFVADKIKKRNTPFFYLITTMATHSPFLGYKNIYTNTFYDSLRSKDNELADYFCSLSYTDMELKKLLSVIQKNIPNTYIFIYGDHTVRSTQKKRPIIYKKDLNLEFVPLIIISPQSENNRNKRIKVASFSHDIGSTILPISEISYKYKLRGYNIFSKNFEKTPIHYYELKLDRKKIFQEIQSFLEINQNK